MDSITQAALGAAVGESLLGKKIGNKAAVIGAVIATIPDLDIVFFPFYSDLERISLHRGFSHSILFSFLSAILIGMLLKRVKWTKMIALTRLILFSWLALFTHMLLDTFTTYGTQLFLPFSDYRAGFDSINIVDPFYTIPLIVGLLFSVVIYRHRSNRSMYNNIGLAVSTFYLLYTLGMKSFVNDKMEEVLSMQNISYHSMLTVPVKFGGVIWYAVAKDSKGLHIGKYIVGKEDEVKFHYFPSNDNLLKNLDPLLVDRMKWFAKGYYTVAEYDNKIRIYNMQCDMQGIRGFGEYKAPTAFYFEIDSNPDGSYELSSGMHPEENK